jgi:hypothetical protein
MLHDILVMYPVADDLTVFFFRYEEVAVMLMTLLIEPVVTDVTVTGVVTLADSSCAGLLLLLVQLISANKTIRLVSDSIRFILGNSFG